MVNTLRGNKNGKRRLIDKFDLLKMIFRYEKFERTYCVSQYLNRLLQRNQQRLLKGSLLQEILSWKKCC